MRSDRRRMTARIVALRSDEASDARVPGTPAERLALLAELSRRMWTLTRRPLPSYTRSTMPVRLSSLGEQQLREPVNEDYRDILHALVAEQARFLIVGAHALAVHGYPRATVDIDIWIDPSDENAQRVWRALATFGAPLDDLDIDQRDFTRPDVVAQLGLPPNRIDILTGVSGLTFESAWNRRVEAPVEGVTVPVLGVEDLVANKRASGREKDRADILGLEGRS